MTTDDGTVYMVLDGDLVPAYECSWTQSTVTCSENGEFAFSVLNMNWVQFPLPEGRVVDATPNGWWVVQGDQAVPVDTGALQQANGPVPVEELIAMGAHGGSPWPSSMLGYGWAYVWVGVAVVAVAATTVLFRRRHSRPSST